MRNTANRLTLKPRSSIVLPDHVSIKLHEQSGSTVAYTGKLNGAAFSGSFSSGAAPTWTRGGAQPPASNTTVNGLADAATHANLVSVLTPPTTGGLVFLWSFYQTAYTNNASAISVFLQFGNPAGTGDGYRIGFIQGANNNVTLAYRGAGEGSNTDALRAANTLSTRQTAAQYLKTDDGALAAYTSVNGGWSNAQVNTSTGSFSHTVPTNFAGASLFTSLDTGTTLGTNYMNRGATDDKVLSDLLVLVDRDGTLFSAMPEIAAEHAKFPFEKLWTLDQ